MIITILNCTVVENFSAVIYAAGPFDEPQAHEAHLSDEPKDTRVRNRTLTLEKQNLRPCCIYSAVLSGVPGILHGHGPNGHQQVIKDAQCPEKSIMRN